MKRTSSRRNLLCMAKSSLVRVAVSLFSRDRVVRMIRIYRKANKVVYWLANQTFEMPGVGVQSSRDCLKFLLVVFL